MKRIMHIILIFIVFFLVLIFLGKLVSLKYVSDYVEGSFTSDYYKEKSAHDVIFLGDCEAYTSFTPIEMYEKYGITSYIRGNSQQLIGQSYYLLEETLKYEKPKIVVLSVGLMRYDKQTKEEYNRLMLDKMKWSMEKIKAINYSILDNESFLSYVFPILRYHDRITSLKKEDFKYILDSDVISHNGFIINTDIKPLTKLPNKNYLSNYQFSDENLAYLKKIYLLCQENNITLILYKSPTVYPFWYDEYEKQINDFAIENNVDYYNFIALNNEIKIDYITDTYDSGVHLNLNGARKLSKYFGQILKEKYHLADYRKNDIISKEYEKKIERYYREVNEKSN